VDDKREGEKEWNAGELVYLLYWRAPAPAH